MTTKLESDKQAGLIKQVDDIIKRIANLEENMGKGSASSVQIGQLKNELLEVKTKILPEDKIRKFVTDESKSFLRQTDLDKALKEIKDVPSKLEKKFIELQTTLSELQQKFNALNKSGDSTTLKTALEALQSKVDNMFKQLASLSEIKGLTKDEGAQIKTGFEKEVLKINDVLKGLKETIDRSSKSSDDKIKDLAKDLEAKLMAVRTTNPALENSVKAQAELIRKLETVVGKSANQTELEALKALIKSSSNELDNMRKQLESLSKLKGTPEDTTKITKDFENMINSKTKDLTEQIGKLKEVDTKLLGADKQIIDKLKNLIGEFGKEYKVLHGQASESPVPLAPLAGGYYLL